MYILVNLYTRFLRLGSRDIMDKKVNIINSKTFGGKVFQTNKATNHFTADKIITEKINF